jgi:hypothetical protein
MRSLEQNHWNTRPQNQPTRTTSALKCLVQDWTIQIHRTLLQRTLLLGKYKVAAIVPLQRAVSRFQPWSPCTYLQLNYGKARTKGVGSFTVRQVFGFHFCPGFSPPSKAEHRILDLTCHSDTVRAGLQCILPSWIDQPIKFSFSPVTADLGARTFPFCVNRFVSQSDVSVRSRLEGIDSLAVYDHGTVKDREFDGNSRTPHFLDYNPTRPPGDPTKKP